MSTPYHQDTNKTATHSTRTITNDAQAIDDKSTAQKYLETTEMGFATKPANYKRGDVLNRWFMPDATPRILPPTGPTAFLLGMQYFLCNEESEFFQLMRINFRLQKTVPWLRRLFADVSSLRSSWADLSQIHVCGEPSGTTTHIFPRVLRFPLSVSLHQCPSSLHLDTTLYQEKHRISKKYQIVFFYVVYPLSYRVPVRERYGYTLLPATREQHDQNCTQSH